MQRRCKILRIFAPKCTPTAPSGFVPIKKGLENFPKPLNLLAGATRLELATSGVTGRRSDQTELHPRENLWFYP